MSASWMSGYVGDVPYTLGFYRELAPTFLNMACVLNGIDGLRVKGPLRYCELGCGRGYGLTLLAAANPDIEFVGIDFNPSHIVEARSLASKANIANLTFFEMAFGEASQSNDPRLADFDVVVLHGVYTWVERPIRADIHQFIRNKLLAGGLVYNSYNTLPGWATMLPIQRLMIELAQRSSRESIAVINESQSLFNTLVEHNAAFVTQNPGIKNRLERMGAQDKAYLAHEFLNTGWEPLYVTDVMRSMSEAKLTYVGSASLIENLIDLCVPKALQPMVNAAPDTAMRELLKDYIVNKQFRRDIYVKGPQVLAQRDQRRKFSELVFANTLMSAEMPGKFQVPVGEISPKKEAIDALLEVTSSGPATGAQILAAGEKAGLRANDIGLLLMILINAGVLAPGRPYHAGIDCAMSQRLNRAVMQLTAIANTHRFLASPVLGSAIPVPFLDRIIASDILEQPGAEDAAIASLAFDRLTASGQSFQRDGKPLAKTDENLAEIAKLVRDFRNHRLRRWQVLGAMPG